MGVILIEDEQKADEQPQKLGVSKKTDEELILELSEGKSEIEKLIRDIVESHGLKALYKLVEENVTGLLIKELTEKYRIEAKNLMDDLNPFYTDHIHFFANYKGCNKRRQSD